MEPKVVIQPVIIKNEKFTTNTMAEQEADSVINFNEEYRIPINKSVLCKKMSLFTSMMNHGFKEANAKEIDVRYDADVTVLKALVDYIHNGTIELITGNLEPVIRAAIYFQLDDLMKLCCNVLIQNTDLQTVGNVYNFAKELALIEPRKAVVDFEAEHFPKIVKSEVFCEWLVDCMLELLSSDEVVVSNEKKILKFVFDWLNVDPNERGEHATDLFRTLRFSFLNETNMKEVVEGNSNEKLGQILQQVASEFSNKSTPPRIYQEGMYLCGYTLLKRYNPTTDKPLGSDMCLVRYCPNDGIVTNLKTPYSRRDDKIVVNDEDIYLVKLNPESNDHIQLEKYDVKKDTWTSTASTAIATFNPLTVESVSICQEKIFVFIQSENYNANNARWVLNFCMMYCIKTNTWSRVSAIEGKPIRSSTTCGDCIYMTRDKSLNILQYKPSTGELIDNPCQYDLSCWMVNYAAIAYKANILFLPSSPYSIRRSNESTEAVMFNTETKDFRLYDFTETFKTYDMHDVDDYLFWALFKDSVYVFTEKNLLPGRVTMKVFKLDLSFIDEMEKLTLIPLPDVIGMKNYILSSVSIQ